MSVRTINKIWFCSEKNQINWEKKHIVLNYKKKLEQIEQTLFCSETDAEKFRKKKKKNCSESYEYFRTKWKKSNLFWNILNIKTIFSEI